MDQFSKYNEELLILLIYDERRELWFITHLTYD